MAITCIGKKLPSAEGNILSTQNNVIQPMNNCFQFSANKVILFVYRVYVAMQVFCVLSNFLSHSNLYMLVHVF